MVNFSNNIHRSVKTSLNMLVREIGVLTASGLSRGSKIGETGKVVE